MQGIMAGAKILIGKPFATSLLESLKHATSNLRFKPALTIIRTTDRTDSDVYIKRKVAVMESLNFPCRVVSAQKETDIGRCIDDANNDDRVHGILMQLPLANNHINTRALIDRIDPIKDVDGLHTINMGKLITGRPYITPCTPLAVMSLLEHYKIPISGQRVAMIGRSMVVGTPLSILFTQKCATVTLCHSQTNELSNILSSSEIVIAAIGKANFIQGTWLKPGCTVIDVGINRMDDNQQLVGDVDFGSAEKVASAISPVPGGIGPLTVAKLAHNLWQAYRTQTAGMEMEIDHVDKVEYKE